ncbi:MAG: glycosyltransferase family 2 protein [Ruminococcaceae bacterium]|nr:glycosyltransferase family 2 protein [Oscillospiraceae bacterium]
MKLSLIIPCYNEASNIAPFFQKVTSTFSGHISNFELIFVNDGSKDDTLKNLKEILSSTNVDMKIINFSRNFGKEAAMFAGIKESSGDYVSLIDADLQQDPEYIVKMVEFLDENKDYDCVAAYQDERHESAIKIFFKNCFYKLINRLAEVDFKNGASDFRTFRRPVADAIISMGEYHRFSKGIFPWVGFETYYMPYDTNARLSGTSSWSLIKLFKYAFEGIVAFTTTPLKISSWIGGLSSITALIYMIVVIVQKLAFSIAIPGYATIVVLILFFNGLQLMTLGIIGEYLSKTYIQTKKRPIYITKEILENKKPR